MKKIFLIVSTFFCFLLLNTAANAQMLHISGRVLDDDTGEGLPIASVAIVGVMGGTTTDMDGYFSFDMERADSLAVTMVGYKRLAKAVPTDTTQRIIFKMKAETSLISEVIIRPDGYERILFRKMLKNKKLNQLRSFDSYKVEEYAKVELDLHQIDKKLKDSKIMQPFAFAFTNIDSTSDEKPFLPAFMSEALADIYYTKGEPEVKKDYKARRVSGINNPTIAEFIQNMHDDVNVYDNWITLVGKSFASPLGIDGFGYYNYYLLDSAKMNGQKAYRIKFKPKRKQENTFFGEFWLTDTTFALAQINMRMSPEVNINFINRIILYQDFGFQASNKKWYPEKVKAIIDFAPTDKTPGLIGRKSISYKNYAVNDPEISKKIKEIDPEMVNPENLKKDMKYWESVRHDSLTKSEKQVYRMVDSIKNVPIFKTYTELANLVATGSKDIGPIQIGSVYNFYNSNPVQGDRFKLTLGTSLALSKEYKLQVFGAYGLRDKVFRFGGKGQWTIQKYPQRTILGAAYRNEIDVSTANSEETLSSSLLSGLVRRPIPQKLVEITEGKLFLERWWTKGWMTRVTALHYDMLPLRNYDGNGNGLNFNYQNPSDPTSNLDRVIASEVIVRGRYAYGEKFIDGVFGRTSLSTKYPKVMLQYTHGFKGVMGSQFNYDRLSVNYNHFFKTNPIGWMRYDVRIGKTFSQGPLPYLLLEVMPGNETYMIERNNFNTMNRFEFAADTYAALTLTQHFDGYLLNHIPLLRKLKLREVAYFKAIYGTMDDANKNANAGNYVSANINGNGMPLRSPSVNGIPYMEAGFGIENILKVLRFDVVYRLNYHDNLEAPRVVPMAGLEFNF
jgi:hypothetical protein